MCIEFYLILILFILFFLKKKCSNVLRKNSIWALKNLVFNAPWILKKYVLLHVTFENLIRFDDYFDEK